MRISQRMLEHKTLVVALIHFAQQTARELRVEGVTGVSELCRALGANRTSVYEQSGRLTKAVEALATAPVGRPPRPRDERDPTEPALQLTIEVLQYRLSHPGSVEPGHGRTRYAPEFRRFILRRLDDWKGRREDFAAAVQVPLLTLVDWLELDRKGLMQSAVAKPALVLPVDASRLTADIARAFEEWSGTTKAFIGWACERFALSAGQLVRVLRILGALAPRTIVRFRWRNSTKRLTPGAVVVTDGKTLDIELTGSQTRTSLNWMGTVDQATGCDAAVVVSDEECAGAVQEAYAQTVSFLGGVRPLALLHDNKPCYQDAALQQHVIEQGTELVAATLGRAENKAIVEGEFSLFEARVGTLRLDDSSRETLIRSCAREVIRAYVAATNGVPRTELGGRSRLETLRESCPSAEQQEVDREFIRRLKSDHQPRRKSVRPGQHAAARALLDVIFQRPELRDKDPRGALRTYLSRYDCAAIRQATTVLDARSAQGDLDARYAHRYLTKVIQSKQEELELERAAEELLRLNRELSQAWIRRESELHDQLRQTIEGEALACALAEHAAHGGLPVQGAFWTEKLLQYLGAAPQFIGAARAFLVRLYEAPVERRLSLIDRISALQCGVA